MANKNTERSKARIKRHRDAGFKQTVVFIAPETSTQVQEYAFKVAKKLGLSKPVL